MSAGPQAALPRRDIMAICAYLNRRPATPVDARAERHLDRLAAAARMQ